jgi:hypothetical protein
MALPAYFNQYPDVAAAYALNNYGLTPEQYAQVHYQNYGANEQRISPQVAEVAAAGTAASALFPAPSTTPSPAPAGSASTPLPSPAPEVSVTPPPVVSASVAANTGSNVTKLTNQILGQGTTANWSGEGKGSPEANAADMAGILDSIGITDVNQLGRLPDGSFGNKLTGQPVPTTYGERQTGNAFGGTFSGSGNTGYRVEFDATGTPLFYTTGASSSDVPSWVAPALVLGAAYFGLNAAGLLGGSTAAAGTGLGTGLTAGAGGLGLSTTGAGLGALGTGAGITAGTGLGTGVLAGSTLGTGLLGAGALTGAAALGGTTLGATGTGLGASGLGAGSSLGTGITAGASGLGLTTTGAGLGAAGTGAGITAGTGLGTGILTGSGLGTTLLGAGAGTGLTGTGILTGSNLGTTLLGTGAGTAVTGGVTGLGAGTLGTGALTTGVGAGAGAATGLGGLTAGQLGSLLSGGLTTGSGLLQQQTSREAAIAAQQMIDRETAAAKTAAQFRPIGMTTRFGTSQFQTDPVTGQLTSAGYTLSPEAKAQQDRLVALSNAGLTQAEAAQTQFAPLQTGAQSLFALGNRYLAQTPEAVAQNYLASQMALLQPGRELELANLQNRLQQQGRGGLSVAQGGTMGATTPELQALFNARAQQEAVLAANAQQAGQQQVLYGAGLLGQGTTAMGNYYAGQQAAYAPYTTALGQVTGLEALGQQPFTLGAQLGQTASTAGARVGQLGLQGAGQSVALATGPAATTNPYSTLLGGLGASPLFGTAAGSALTSLFG